MFVCSYNSDVLNSGWKLIGQSRFNGYSLGVGEGGGYTTQNQRAPQGLQCYILKQTNLMKHSKGQIAHKSQVMQAAVIILKYQQNSQKQQMMYQTKTRLL